MRSSTMRIPFGVLKFLVKVGLFATLISGNAFPQTWPQKPIKLVIGFAPGGATDMVARIVAQKLSANLDQPIVIDNRPGVSGTIAAAHVAKSPPDGYTFTMLTSGMMLGPLLYKRAGYDTLKDFTSVATVFDSPMVLVVNPNVLPHVTDVQKLAQEAREKSGSLNYASSGAGGLGHIGFELLKQRGNFDMQHIAYKGTAPAINDVIAGHVPVMYTDLVGALPHVKSGALRAIGTGSLDRLSVLPDLKPIAEQGFPGFETVAWGGFVMPAGVPIEIVKKMSDEVRKVLSEKSIQDEMIKAGVIAHYESPSLLTERLHKSYAKWGAVIRDKGIVSD